MALGYTERKILHKNVQYRWRLFDLTFDTDYPASGYPLTAASFKLNAIIAVIPLTNPAGFVLSWDRANNKLQVFWGDYSASSDGVHVEIPAGENSLANVVASVLVVGY